MFALPTLAVFGPIDGIIVAVYFLLVILVGFVVARKDTGSNEVFLGGRNLPTWAIAVSLVVTMLSTATFVGVPDDAFAGDISYLILNLGGFIAAFVVAFLFVPRLYHANTVTIYGFLTKRFGEPARLAVSSAFILGRMLSSGARLFLAAFPLCLLMFGAKMPSFSEIAIAIVLISGVGTIYAVKGGIRAIVWIDTIQLAIVVGTAAISIVFLMQKIPLSLPEIFQVLAQPTADGTSKLHILDWSTDPAKPYTFWTAIFGSSFMMIAAFGTDHDLAQRFMMSKSPAKGAVSVIASQFLGIAVVLMFLSLGLLLYIYYRRPDIVGAVHAATETGKSIYPWFLLNELPTGLAGLAIAGFFAVAQGSLDSAMNALAASIVADVYEPLKRNKTDDNTRSRTPKLAVAVVGGFLCLFALFCAWLYDPRYQTLLGFVLSVMTFAYTGMLGVFLTALFTRRGNSASVIAALITGAATVAMLQDRVMGAWMPWLFGTTLHIAWPWWMTIGTVLSFLVCVAGSPRKTA